MNRIRLGVTPLYLLDCVLLDVNFFGSALTRSARALRSGFSFSALDYPSASLASCAVSSRVFSSEGLLAVGYDTSTFSRWCSSFRLDYGRVVFSVSRFAYSVV